MDLKDLALSGKKKSKSIASLAEAKALIRELRGRLTGKENIALVDWLEDSFEYFTKISQRAEIVATCAYELAEAASTVEVLEATLSDAIRITGAERGYMLLWNDESRELERVSLQTDGRTGLPNEQLEICDTMARHAFDTGEVLINPDVQANPKFCSQSLKELQIRSVIVVPLLTETDKGSQNLGVVYLDSRATNKLFSEDDGRLMKAFASLAGLSLSNARASRQLRQAYFETVAALIRALEAKDKYTSGHSERVAEYCVRCGRFMGMDQERLIILRSAGLLHDIGKIGVRDSVLFKPGKLTDEEYEHVKLHADLSENIVRGLSFLEEELEILSGSQEHYDGTGYPRGTKGDEISIEGYIIQVADAWDAMTSTRVYRRKMNPEKAVAELRRCNGTQFHPDVVEAFLGMIEKDGIIDSEELFDHDDQPASHSDS